MVTFLFFVESTIFTYHVHLHRLSLTSVFNGCPSMGESAINQRI